jgi:hypothetical protein
MTSLRNQKVITGLFNNYDSERKGSLTKEQLRHCINDLTERKIGDLELNYIFDLFQPEGNNILLSSFINVIDGFFRFC